MGLAAAVVMPATLAVLMQGASADWRRWVGAWTAVVGLGVAAGPLLGAVLLVGRRCT
jgi:MFS family permease